MIFRTYLRLRQEKPFDRVRAAGSHASHPPASAPPGRRRRRAGGHPEARRQGPGEGPGEAERRTREGSEVELLDKRGRNVAEEPVLFRPGPRPGGLLDPVAPGTYRLAAKRGKSRSRKPSGRSRALPRPRSRPGSRSRDRSASRVRLRARTPRRGPARTCIALANRVSSRWGKWVKKWIMLSGGLRSSDSLPG